MGDVCLYSNELRKDHDAVRKLRHKILIPKFYCLAICAYIVSTGRQKKLMLAVSGSKRDCIESLFQKIKKYKSQLEHSTA